MKKKARIEESAGKPLQDVLKEYENKVNGNSSPYELREMLEVLWTVKDAITSVELKIDRKIAPMLEEAEKAKKGKK